MLPPESRAAIRRAAATVAVRCRDRGVDEARIASTILDAILTAAQDYALDPWDIETIETLVQQAVAEELGRPVGT